MLKKFLVVWRDSLYRNDDFEASEVLEAFDEDDAVEKSALIDIQIQHTFWARSFEVSQDTETREYEEHEIEKMT